MFQVEQRLQRVQQQLKEMRQATADADPERKSRFRPPARPVQQCPGQEGLCPDTEALRCPQAC